MTNPQEKINGRPAGEVRRALLQAAVALSMGDKAPTLRELARKARVGQSAARVAVSNMRRAGSLVIVRKRHVKYRNRPVAEYAPPALPVGLLQPGDEGYSFQSLCSVWHA